jgi:hypothetical protein
MFNRYNKSLIREIELKQRDFFLFPWEIVDELVCLGGEMVLFGDGVHVFAEMLLEDLDEEGEVGAVEVEADECNFQGLDVVTLVGVVLEVVLLGGEGEAADGDVGELGGGGGTRSRRLSGCFCCQFYLQLSRVITSAMWN